jgi:Protein of unknown function (DUF2723)
VIFRRQLTWAAFCAAAAFFLAHLPFLARRLDDIDGVNFAMGVADFDVTLHRPHPPGYPLYILLGKLSLGLASITGLTAHTGIDWYAWTLAFWGALAGALAVFPLIRIFRAAGGDAAIALGAALLTVSCPLFWFSASRPMSDIPGLAAAMAVQALLAEAFVRQEGWRDRAVRPAELVATGRLIVLSAMLAGLAAGLRSQTVWLTVPLLVIVITDRAGRGAAGAALGSTITFIVGVLVWFVPLLIVEGGPGRYFAALTSQAGEDIEGVDMLITSTRPVRRLAFNLLETFVYPWVSLPLAIAVLALAAVGVYVMLRSQRRGLTLLAGSVGPYLLFHLLWQENLTTRYALPFVPVVAFLCVRGCAAILRTFSRAAAPALAAASLTVAMPSVVAYGQPESVPATRLVSDFRRADRLSVPRRSNPSSSAGVVIAMHRRVFTETRRLREWEAPDFPWRVLPAPRHREWLELVKYWRAGGKEKVWFAADPRRTDLALIDPASRHFNGHYAWPFGHAPAYIGGVRPDEVTWHVIDSPPGWFLGEGWALTPETAGLAEEESKGPAHGRALGWIRRRPEATRLVIGGRNLGAVTDADVRFTLFLDGRAIDEWTVRPSPGFFLRSLELPAGSLSTPSGQDATFAEIAVVAKPADGTPGSAVRKIRAAIEQFDLQNADRVQYGFDEGWHEDEYNPRTGLRWRWSSDASALRIWNAGHDVRVRLRAESPLRTFDEAPTVTVSAGALELARIQPEDAFDIDVRVPAGSLAQSGGRVVLRTTSVFVPAERVGAGDPRRNDRRRLGLRVFHTSVTRHSPDR